MTRGLPCYGPTESWWWKRPTAAKLDVGRVTFKWLRRGDGPREDVTTWDREALPIAIVSLGSAKGRRLDR
jgi:hypothetical protein